MASNTQYHLRDSQRILYILRIAQILLALVYLTLLCYSGVNRGWWLNLSQPLALGGTVHVKPKTPATISHTDTQTVTAAILTLPIAAPILFAYNSANAAADRRTFVLHYARVIAEWLLIALWAASFITMLLPKGKNFQVLFQQPPYAEWDVAVALAGFETYVLFM